MKVKILILFGLLTLSFVSAYAQPPCYTIDTSRPEWLTVPGQFIRGDANNDGVINIADVAYLLNYLFIEGSPPTCMDAGDANDDGTVNIADVAYLLNYLFMGGPPPPSPWRDFPDDCGPDPTPDALNCLTHICVTGPVTTEARFEKAREENRVMLGEAEIIDHKLIVPVYITTSQPLSVFSYTISYDPTELVAISVDRFGLVSEDFDFFSGWIDDEIGEIKVGNVVSLGMAKTLPAGTYKVATLVLHYASSVSRFTKDVSLRVTEVVFAESGVSQKTQPGERRADLPTQEVPISCRGTIEIVFPPDGTTFELYETQTLQFDVTAICTPPGCFICVWAEALPLGAFFREQCLYDSVTSTFTWTPHDCQAGTYTIPFFARRVSGCPPLKDTVEVHIIVNEYTDLGDTAISDHHEDFRDRGFCVYEPGDTVGDLTTVGLVYGNLTHDRRDLYIPGPGFPLEITFTYNSGTFFNGRYGFGWQLNYNIRYVTNHVNENVIIAREDDRTDIFVKQPDGSFKATYGIRDSLSQEPVGYKLTTKHGIKYYFDSPDHHYVTKIEDPNGNILTFSYNADKQLTTVTDTCGREINFIYNEFNKLVEITDPADREWHYEYDGDELIGVTDPLGNTTSYTYSPDGCHDLTSITDVRGNTRTIVYNSNYQVVEMIAECCDLKTFSYDLSNRRTTVTDANGHQTVYTYDERDRLIEIKDHLGNVMRKTWDDNYNVTSETDANGNTTYWTYDSKGNVLTEVNALGDTTWYTWHPVFNKMTSQTDANYDTTTYEYDSLGNLILQINPLGDSTRYWYYSLGLMDSTMNARGFLTRYEYDDCANRIKVIDAKFCTTSYFYDIVGNDTLAIDANDHPTRYVYDELDRLIRTIDALNCTTSYFYDAVGNDTLVINANGDSTRYEYDELNRLVKTIDALGGETHYTYDPVGNRISETNCKGDSARYEYDGLNRLIRTIDALNCTTSHLYDAVGNDTLVIDANHHATRHVYDELNRLTKTIDALNCTTSHSYDAVGNDTLVIDGNGKATYYRYDELDRLWRIVREMETEADSAVTEYEYDEVWNRTAVIDPNANRTEYEYNERDELTKETNPEAESTLYTYDGVGNRKTQTRPNGNVITYGYDNKSQLINISDLIGQGASYTYDCVGNRRTETDANDNTTTYEYDALNRLVRAIDPMDDTTTYTYDCVGNLETLVDRNGNLTTYTYDAVDRRDSTTDALGNATGYEYDCVGNLRRITDANGNATSYRYDEVNRLIRETYADSTTKEFTYDCVGNIKTRIDQNGDTTSYKYDDLYRLVKRDYPDDNDDTLSYDKGGRLLTAENAHSFGTFDYDSADRVVEATQNGYTISYGYDVVANTRTITYPGGKIVTETRDLRGRLVEVEETAKGIIAHYVYDDADRLLSRNYLNGTVASYHYNANDWVDSLTHTKDATLIAGFGHDFDKEGNRKYAENLLPFDPTKEYTHSEKYDYDAIYRLIDFKTGQLVGGDIPSPIKTRGWTLDPVGNWDQFAIDGIDYNNTPNQMNEYDDSSTTNCQLPVPGDDDGIPDDFKDPLPSPPYDGFNSAHDCNGNLVDDDINMYEYDYENRLIRVIGKSDGDTLGEYRYDALGRRIEKDVANVTIVYLYDGIHAVEERIGGLVEGEYVYGTWIDEVLTMNRSGQTYYYHANSLGSIVALTDALSNAVERYIYDAYGKVTIMDGVGTFLPSSAVASPYLFTGRRLDEETGLYYYRVRYYSAERGRFLQRDLFGYVDNRTDLYEFVRSNPMNLIDLMGDKGTPSPAPRPNPSQPHSPPQMPPLPPAPAPPRPVGAANLPRDVPKFHCKGEGKECTIEVFLEATMIPETGDFDGADVYIDASVQELGGPCSCAKNTKKSIKIIPDGGIYPRTSLCKCKRKKCEQISQFWTVQVTFFDHESYTDNLGRWGGDLPVSGLGTHPFGPYAPIDPGDYSDNISLRFNFTIDIKDP